jgi:hypothetical protein
VLLMTTSLDADWSTLPTTSFYLPFVQSMVRYLADTSSRRTVLGPGEAIELPIDPSTPAGRVKVSTPDGQERQVEILRRGPLAYVRFTDTQQPGLYEVKVDAAVRPLHFVVHGPQDESDLTVLSVEKREWLRRSLDVETVDTASRPIGASTVGSTGSRELWAWVLGAVLLLAVAEMALARRWARTESSDADGGFDPVTPAGAERS